MRKVRTTIIINEDILRAIEKMYGKKEYINFSAVVNDLLRRVLNTENLRKQRDERCE